MQNTITCDVGIVGAGIIGLTSALDLVQTGYRVVVIARNLPGDQTTEWSSPWAGAAMLPSASDNKTDIAMQRRSFEKYMALANEGPATGVQKVKVTEYWDDEEQRVNPWYSVVPEFSSLSVWELPPGIEGGNRFTSTAINPDLLLPWLQSVLEKSYGVVFIKDTVSSLESAAQRLGCKALVNATGLGAGQLAGDNKVLGIRGQTLLIKSSALAPSLEHQLVIRRGREYTYLIPRMDGGVVLGGIEDPGNTSINVDVALRPDIIRRVNVMTRGRFRGFDLERDVIRDIVGFRPGREGGFRVERESNVIHAYGFAGAGYRYSWGVSSKVVDLVDELGFRKQQSKL